MAENKKNLIIPSSPMFISIMEPHAASLIEKLCKIKPMNAGPKGQIDCVREAEWRGPENEFLEQTTLKVGTVGLVVGLAEPKTTLRFLVVAQGKSEDDAIYHVSVLNLEEVSKG